MLTVKLVEASGHEQLYEASIVWTDPKENDVFIKDGTNGETVSFRVGLQAKIYVMNSDGKTISVYTYPLQKD